MTDLNQGAFPNPLSKGEAYMKIESIRQEIYTMGNNDREFNIIDFEIVPKLTSGEITPEKAVEEVEKLKSNKLEP